MQEDDTIIDQPYPIAQTATDALLWNGGGPACMRGNE